MAETVTEAHVAALHDKHKAEINDMVKAFGARHAELANVPAELADPKALAAHKQKFRAAILEAVGRHTKAENELSAKIGAEIEPEPVATS